MHLIKDFNISNSVLDFASRIIDLLFGELSFSMELAFVHNAYCLSITWHWQFHIFSELKPVPAKQSRHFICTSQGLEQTLTLFTKKFELFLWEISFDLPISYLVDNPG